MASASSSIMPNASPEQIPGPAIHLKCFGLNTSTQAWACGQGCCHLLGMEVCQAPGSRQGDVDPIVVPAEPPVRGAVSGQGCSQVPSLHVLCHHHHLDAVQSSGRVTHHHQPSKINHGAIYPRPGQHDASPAGASVSVAKQTERSGEGQREKDKGARCTQFPVMLMEGGHVRQVSRILQGLWPYQHTRSRDRTHCKMSLWCALLSL